MNNNLINSKSVITDELTLRLINYKRIRHCRECKHSSMHKTLKCSIYPAMDDMQECYKFEMVDIKAR